MIGDGLADLECAGAVALVFLVRNALDSPGLAPHLAATPNAWVLQRMRGDGWAELAGALLAAQA
jgi:hypothetical protein